MNLFDKLTILTALQIFFVFQSFGQTDSLQPLILRSELGFMDIAPVRAKNEMKIVSASRSAKSIDDLPVTVHVISRDEILRNGYITLVDVLKSVPGMRVSQPGDGDFGEMFLMRGLLGNYYTKILVDNMPVAPSVNGYTSIGAQLPVRQAERIEIIYGPASAVYGADATTGVINIITKNAGQHTIAQADVCTGGNGYSYLNFLVGGRAGKDKRVLEYTLAGSHYEFQNMNIFYDHQVYNPLDYIELKVNPKYKYTFEVMGIDDIALLNEADFPRLGFTTQTFIDTLYQSNYEGTYNMPDIKKASEASQSVNIKLKYKNITTGYDYMFREGFSNLGRTSYLFKYNNPSNLWGQHVQRYYIAHSKDWERWSSATNISLVHYKLDNTSSRSLTYLKDVESAYYFSASDDILGEQLITYRYKENLEIVGGLAFQFSGCLPVTNELMEPFDVEKYTPFCTDSLPEDPYYGSFGLNPFTFNEFGGFVQVFFSFKKLIIIGGSRYNHNTRYGSSFNPRIATLFKWSDRLIFRYSSGNSFKAPSSTYSHYSLAVPTEDGGIHYAFLPNEDLEPEIFKCNEFGFRYKISEKIVLDFSIYDFEIENLISSHFVELDTIKYPNATQYEENPRMNINSSGAKSELAGIQITLTGTDLIKAIKLRADLTMHISAGTEILPNDSAEQIEAFRMMPNFIGQLKLSAEPIENLYINIETLGLSNWYRRYIPSSEVYLMEYSKIEGYSTVDILLGFRFSKHFYGYVKVLNVFNKGYGGIDVTGSDVDLRYNPQLQRNFRLGLSFNLE